MSLDAPTRDERPAAGEQGSDRAEGRGARRRREDERRKGGTKGGPLTAVLFFALPSALALALILRGISDRQLWRDEHATWWAATLSFHDLSVLIRTIDVVFTPYYVLMHLWVSIAGDSETAMRLPGALAMAAAPGLLALLGRRMFTPQVGMVAGLAYAVVPSVTRYGQEIRPYAFAVAAVLLSTLLLVRALDQPAFKVWVAYTLSVPLIGWSHLASLAVLAPHLLMVANTRKEGDRIAGWAYAAAGGLGVCFVFPMAVAGSGQSGQIAWNNPTFQDLLDFPKNLFGAWGVAVPVMVLGLLGLFFAGKRALPLLVWVVVPPALTFVTAAQLHLFLPRYLLFTAPAWVLMAAVALCRLSGPVCGPRAGSGPAALRAVGWVLGLAAVAGLAFQALPGMREARVNVAGEPDFRGAARYIGKEGREGDGIAYSGVMSERRAMDYELRNDEGRPRDVLMYRSAAEEGGFGARECPQPAECLKRTKRLWLVATSPDGNPFSNMPGANVTALKKHYRAVRTEKLDNLQVVLLERRPEKKDDKADDNDAARRKVHI